MKSYALWASLFAIAVTESACDQQTPDDSVTLNAGDNAEEAAIAAQRDTLAHNAVGAIGTPSAKPVYGVSDIDFSFAENATHMKRDVVDSINSIVASNENCTSVDTGSLVSESEKASRNPGLQIACHSVDGKGFAVRFHALDAKAGKTFDAIQPISEARAMDICLEQAQRKLGDSDAAFNLTETAFSAHPGGSAVVIGGIDSNSKHYRVTCHFRGEAIADASVDQKPT